MYLSMWLLCSVGPTEAKAHEAERSNRHEVAGTEGWLLWPPRLAVEVATGDQSNSVYLSTCH